MIVEDFGIPKIVAQGIDRPMPAHVHHLEDRGTWRPMSEIRRAGCDGE
jgi:hypothetical protein